MILLNEEERERLQDKAGIDKLSSIRWGGEMIAKVQLKKVLGVMIAMDGAGESLFPFHYAISKDVMREWLKEVE